MARKHSQHNKRSGRQRHTFIVANGTPRAVEASTLIVRYHGRLCDGNGAWHPLGSQPETCDKCWSVT